MPEDPSLNTAAGPAAATHNWVGPVGAYTADLVFQGFGWVAYLIPMLLLVVGTRWLMVRPFAAPKTKAVGAGLLVISLSALLELFPYTPAVRGLIHGSGMLGYVAAAGLIHTFNRLGRRHRCRHGVSVFVISGHSLFLFLGGRIFESALAGAGGTRGGAVEDVAGSPRGGRRGAPPAPRRSHAIARQDAGHLAEGGRERKPLPSVTKTHQPAPPEPQAPQRNPPLRAS